MITYYVDNTTNAGHAAADAPPESLPGGGCRVRGLLAAGARRRRRGSRPDLRPRRRREQPDRGHQSAVHRHRRHGGDLQLEPDPQGQRPRRRAVGDHVEADAGLHAQPHLDVGRSSEAWPASIKYKTPMTAIPERSCHASLGRTRHRDDHDLLVLMLMSALLVGFTAVVMSDQRYRFIDRDRGQAFYAASGGDREADRRPRQPVLRQRRADAAQVTILTVDGEQAGDYRRHLHVGAATPRACRPARCRRTTAPRPARPSRPSARSGYTIMFCADAAAIRPCPTTR